jgi:hypothetical protein
MKLVGAMGFLLAVMLAGCAIEPTFRGTLEVWNRTEAPITIVGRDASFGVPACSHVVQEAFVLNRYDIVDDQGRFIARHGGGGSDPAHVIAAYEMVTSAGADSADRNPPQEPLPACAGVLEGQPTDVPS